MDTRSAPLPVVPASPTVVLRHSNALAYVGIVLGMGLLVMVSVVLVTLIRPALDNTPIYTIVVGFGITMTASLATFIKSERTEQAVQEVHILLNSQLQEFKTEMRAAAVDAIDAAKARGVVEGQQIAAGAARSAETLAR